jgi:hypothetical protein
MICNEQTQTRRKTPESLGEDDIEECRLNNGACPRPVYLGGTLPFQASDTMRILISMFRTPGRRIRIDRLLRSWLLDQLSEREGCNAGTSHETGLATRLLTMRPYRSCTPNPSLDVWLMGLPRQNHHHVVSVDTGDNFATPAFSSQSPTQAEGWDSSNIHHNGVGPRTGVTSPRCEWCAKHRCNDRTGCWAGN